MDTKTEEGTTGSTGNTGRESCFAKASSSAKASEDAAPRIAAGPKLSDEQREWLNRVFIPNFRAELMRTLELKGLLRKDGVRKSRFTNVKECRRSGDGGETDALSSSDEGGRMKKEKGALNVDESAAATSEDALSADRMSTPDHDGSGHADARLSESGCPSGSLTPARQDDSGKVRELEGEGSAGSPHGTKAEEESDRSGDVDRILELTSENKRLRAALAETRVERELVWAAAQQHAINAAQVAQLLKDRVRLDRNLDPMVVNGNGDRAYDRYGRAVTVADAVRTFLEENPHLVRPSTQLAGGGSGGTDATAMVRRVTAMTGGDLIEEALREGA